MSILPIQKFVMMACLVGIPVLADPLQDSTVAEKYFWVDLVYDFGGDNQLFGAKVNVGGKKTAAVEFLEREVPIDSELINFQSQINLLLGLRYVRPFYYAHVSAGIAFIPDNLPGESWIGVPVETGVALAKYAGIGINLYANLIPRDFNGGIYFNFPIGKSTQRINDAPIPKAISEVPQVKLVSEKKAYLWAAGSTLIPIIPGFIVAVAFSSSSGGWVSKPYDDDLLVPILVGILAVGPSAGQIYAGSWKQGLLGAVLRVAGVAWEVRLSEEFFGDRLIGKVYNTSAGILMVGGTIYSFVDTHYAVKRANKRIAAQRFGFTPELFPSSNGGLKPGVLAWMRF